MCLRLGSQGRGIFIPDKVKRPADVDFEGVPPCIRILFVQLFNDTNNKSLGKLKKKIGGGGGRGSLGAVLTRREYGNCARICDEHIQLSKTLNDALHGTSYALHITHVRSKHEHIRARNGGYDQISRLIEGMRGTSHDRDRCARTRVLQRSLAPESARSACDENDFSAIGSRSVQWLRVDGGVDAGKGGPR